MKAGCITDLSRQAERTVSPKHSSLTDLATASGASIACAGNLPLSLDDPHSVWFIDTGAVDLFLVECMDGVEQSAPQHVLRAESGRLLPGVASDSGDTTFGLIAKGLPGTVLKRLPADSLATLPDAELAAQVDTWLMDVSAMLSRDVIRQPRPDGLVEHGQADITSNGTVTTRRGVVWVTQPPPGTGLFMSLIDPGYVTVSDTTGQGAIPLTPVTWLTLMEPVELSTLSSKSLAGDDLLLPALANFHAVAFSLERLNRSLAVVDQANLGRARATVRRTDEESARRRLFNLYGLLQEESAEADDSALRDALHIIGRREGIDFKWPERKDTLNSATRLGDVLDASGVRARRARLDVENRWWIGDSGAMLSFNPDDNRPVVLLPGRLGRYLEIDPVSGRKTRITSKQAAARYTEAWVFYQPLESGSLKPKDLLAFAGTGQAADFVRFITAGLAGGLIMLLPAVVLGFIVDEVLPNNEISLLYSVTALLAVFALIGALIYVLKGTALMRIEGRATSRIEAAYWDRLLRLPPGFLDRYPAGDLAARGMTFQKLRDAVQGVVANAPLSIIFLAPAFILIFYYDAFLGVVTVAFGIISLIITVILGMRQVAPQECALRASRRLSGRLFEVINGIAKLRVERAEGSAFAVWANDYRIQKNSELELGTLEAHLQAFSAALPLLAGGVLLLAITSSERETITIGDFLVVYTVFLIFQAAVARLGASFGAISAITPAVDQVKPFLAEPTEISVEGEPVETLGGEIVFDHVSFRYDPDGPLILDDVSIHTHPGEFIAIVGESGSGKSTLFRLALGLDQPSSGAVYYDGRDLKHLNIKQVRRQIGAVPQEIQLFPQDVWDNIVGSNEDASVEDVWQAASSAAIDGTIAAMPMGMLTPMSSGVISGGESQRITIARALMRNPRVMLLDEATNSLDNDNQAKVMDNLANLASTRIVIAHRLSTLRQADRIYVMQSGKVVQEGTFTELVETAGVFQDLARRQMT